MRPTGRVNLERQDYSFYKALKRVLEVFTGPFLKLRLRTITYLIFGMRKDADNIYYCTKNQVRGLCVGGDMVILP